MSEPLHEPRPVAINARITETGAGWIRAIAKAEQRTMSDVVRMLLAEAIETRSRAGRLPPKPLPPPKRP